MREIKFRQYVWDNDSKTSGRMVSWEELLQEENESLGANFTQKFSNASELMQYTGLKDKNSVEIYEGDIISRENAYENNCVVKWDDESCGFTLNYIYFDESYNMNEFWDDFEVIGNIHDNPELMDVN